MYTKNENNTNQNLASYVYGSFCEYRYTSLEDFIRHLTSITSEDEFYLRIRRAHVLQDSLVGVNRAAFSPYKILVVSELLAISTFETDLENLVPAFILDILFSLLCLFSYILNHVCAI